MPDSTRSMIVSFRPNTCSALPRTLAISIQLKRFSYSPRLAREMPDIWSPLKFRNRLTRRRSMNYDKLKKGIVSLALIGISILGSGFVSSAFAQYYPRERQIERRWEWREMERIRQMDRDRRLRYRYGGMNRLVGYYHRFGQLHAYGYYDRYGWFHRYY